MNRREVLRAMALGAAAAVAPVQAQTTQPPVVLGQVGLSLYAVTGAVIQDVLERLAHAVEVAKARTK